MPNGYESWQELGRLFDTFRHEDYGPFKEDVADELKFLRRILFTVLGTAVLAGLLTSVFAAIRGV